MAWSFRGLGGRMSWRSLLTGLVLALAAFVLGQNLVLLREVRASRLRGAVTNLQGGRTLASIAGVSLSGVLRRLTFPLERGGRLVVVTIGPACPTCAENQPRYTALAEEIRRRPNWSIIWVSRADLETTARYAAQHHIPPEEVVADPLHRSFEALGLESVPQLAVVEEHGAVLRVWQGREHWDANQVLNATALPASRRP